MRWSFIMILPFACLTCRQEEKIPEGVLSSEKMESVFWDILQADIYAENFLKNDSAGNVELQSAALQYGIFNKHKVTRKQFYDSYRYYSDHPEKLRVMLDSMISGQQRVPAPKKRKLKVFDLNNYE